MDGLCTNVTPIWTLQPTGVVYKDQIREGAITNVARTFMNK